LPFQYSDDQRQRQNAEGRARLYSTTERELSSTRSSDDCYQRAGKNCRRPISRLLIGDLFLVLEFRLDVLFRVRRRDDGDRRDACPTIFFFPPFPAALTWRDE